MAAPSTTTALAALLVAVVSFIFGWHVGRRDRRQAERDRRKGGELATARRLAQEARHLAQIDALARAQRERERRRIRRLFYGPLSQTAERRGGAEQ